MTITDMGQKTKGFLVEFKNFAMRGNVIDLAIGIIVGAGFNTVVQSLVKNIVMPPIGLVVGKVDFANLYLNMSTTIYPSLAAAQQAGAPTLNYGLFINDLISFLITAFVVFLIVRQINKLHRREDGKPTPSTKICPFCASNIPIPAIKCPNCTSDLTKK